jgi:hypothetical protein
VNHLNRQPVRDQDSRLTDSEEAPVVELAHDGQLVELLITSAPLAHYGRGHGGEEFLRGQPMSELTHR